MSAARSERSSSDAPSQPEGSEPRDVSTPPTLTKDEIFDALKASRRRAVLRYLDENGGTATTGTLAEHIAAMENGVDVSAISSSQRKRVYVALYQAHLPRMADFGIVEYDSDRGYVKLCDRADRVLSYLYHDPDADASDGVDGAGAMARCLAILRRVLGRP